MDEEELEEAYEKAVEADTENIKTALSGLIDTLSPFMAARRMDELTTEDFAAILTNLDFTKFVISGVMYTHGLPYCGHIHDEDEED